MPWLFCSSFHAITGLGITPGNGLMRNLSGAVLVIISAIAFGCMPLFTIYAYDAGVDPVTLLFLRFLMAGSLMLAVMLAKKIPFPRGPSLAGLIGMGALGYVGLPTFTVVAISTTEMAFSRNIVSNPDIMISFSTYNYFSNKLVSNYLSRFYRIL
jgi:hypothetical protein